jgi:hypothetical protein
VKLLQQVREFVRILFVTLLSDSWIFLKIHIAFCEFITVGDLGGFLFLYDFVHYLLLLLLLLLLL